MPAGQVIHTTSTIFVNLGSQPVFAVEMIPWKILFNIRSVPLGGEFGVSCNYVIDILKERSNGQFSVVLTQELIVIESFCL